jgi:hypothetical protein
MHLMTKIRPSVESLEDRLALTSTQLILDFTPDTRGRPFQALFTRNPKLTRLLDLNRDGRVNLADAAAAMRQISSRVEALFSQFADLNVKVLFDNSSSGRLSAAQESESEQAAVMYVGSERNPYGNAVKGEAPLADDGTNVEGYGRVYGGTILRALNSNQGATRQTFVQTVAALVAHEFGHMMGLRHTNARASTNLMNPAPSQNSGVRRFINQRVLTEDDTYQNAVAELTASFEGQRDV